MTRPPPSPPSLRDELDALVRSSYPFPLARAWARAQLGATPQERIKAGVECLEVTLRFTLALQLADMLREPVEEAVLREVIKKLDGKQKGGGTEGSYAWALNLLGGALSTRERAKPFVEALAGWRQGGDPQIDAAMKTAISLRNEWAHGRLKGGEERDREVSVELHAALRVLFEGLRPLASFKLFYLYDNPAVGVGRFEGQLAMMSGWGVQPTVAQHGWSAPLLSGGSVYLLAPSGEALLLSPLLFVQDKGHLERLALLSHLEVKPPQLVLRELGDPEATRAEALSVKHEAWWTSQRAEVRCVNLKELQELGDALRVEPSSSSTSLASVQALGPRRGPPRRRGWGALGVVLAMLGCLVGVCGGGVALMKQGVVSVQSALADLSFSKEAEAAAEAPKQAPKQAPPAVAGSPAPAAAPKQDMRAPPAAPKHTPKAPAFTWAAIPAGSFVQGSSPDEVGRRSDETMRRVQLTRPFWMQTTEVTVAQWRDVMGSDPSFFVCGDTCPVELVSWHDAILFLNRASRLAGLTPCYSIREQQGRPGVGCYNGVENEGWCAGDYKAARVTYKPSCDGYRLPTEAEWEYAARAGVTEGRYGPLDRIAWMQGNTPKDCEALGKRQYNARRRAREVGCKQPTARLQPNAWGLYDMLGNVSEWVWDADDVRDALVVVDPRSDEGARRVFKGGGWLNIAEDVRFGVRELDVPSERSRLVGFRVARNMSDAEAKQRSPILLKIRKN